MNNYIWRFNGARYDIYESDISLCDEVIYTSVYTSDLYNWFLKSYESEASEGSFRSWVEKLRTEVYFGFDRVIELIGRKEGRLMKSSYIDFNELSDSEFIIIDDSEFKEAIVINNEVNLSYLYLWVDNYDSDKYLNKLRKEEA